MTGVNAMSAEVGTKRVGLLHELLPHATRFAALTNPNDPNAEPVSKDLKAAAAAVGRRLELFPATNIREIDVAFANLVQKRPDALVIVPQGLLINRRLQIVTLATRHALPAIYPSREFAEIGGLMSYGSSPTDQYRQTGIFTGRSSQGRKTGRYAGPARDQVRVRHQSANGQGYSAWKFRRCCSPAPTR